MRAQISPGALQRIPTIMPGCSDNIQQPEFNRNTPTPVLQSREASSHVASFWSSRNVQNRHVWPLLMTDSALIHIFNVWFIVGS
jgi:hypothetical protein